MCLPLTDYFSIKYNLCTIYWKIAMNKIVPSVLLRDDLEFVVKKVGWIFSWKKCSTGARLVKSPDS